MEWMLMPLRRYADFQGRSRRKEYWMFALGLFLVYFVVVVIGGLLIGFGSATTGSDSATALFASPVIILIALLGLGVLIPSLAVQVRRFHDQDKSGWFVLLGLIPYVGSIIVLVFMCLEGTKGPNRFGGDPKDPSGRNLGDVFS